MLRHRLIWWWPYGMLCAVFFFSPVLSTAGDRIKAARKFNPKDASVDVFQGIENGQLEVKVIAKDAKQCRVFLTNKTDKPLNVSMPSAIAAVPVLAQFRFPPNNNRNNNGNNAPQMAGGGPGNQFGNPGGGPFMNMQQGNNNGNNNGNNFFNLPNVNPGNRFFNIAPEKVAQMKLQTVCLEHGKPNPRPQFQYELKPLTEATDKPEVYVICAMLGDGKLRQHVAQAAAWHLTNDMSWEDLEAKQGEFTFGRYRAPLFSKDELAQAKKAVEEATKQIESLKSSKDPESLSK